MKYYESFNFMFRLPACVGQETDLRYVILHGINAVPSNKKAMFLKHHN